MKAETWFCFVGAFLSASTFCVTYSNIIIDSDNRVRPKKNTRADLKTALFGRKFKNLAVDSNVTITVPVTMFSPPSDFQFHLKAMLRDPNNWIDIDGNREYFYHLDGHLEDIVIETGNIHVIALKTKEYRNQTLLDLKLTFLIDRIVVNSHISLTGTWRTSYLTFENAVLTAKFENVQVLYSLSKIPVKRGQRGRLNLAEYHGVSEVTINHVNTRNIQVKSPQDELLFEWDWIGQGRVEEVDSLIREVISGIRRQIADRMDDVLYEALGDRPRRTKTPSLLQRLRSLG